jgi:hypothetical protein
LVIDVNTLMTRRKVTALITSAAIAAATLTVPAIAHADPTTATAPSSPPGPVSRTTVAYVAGGIAIVGLGLGTAFGIAALDAKSTFDKSPTLDKGNQATDFAVYSDIAFGSAVILGVTSLVLFLTDSPDACPPPIVARGGLSFSATPTVTAHGAGAGATIRF